MTTDIKPLWISVEDGDIFEGHQLHWSNCFFSNAYRREIEGFLTTKGAIQGDLTFELEGGLCSYVIREMTPEELVKYPEALEFCKQLIEEYGEY